MRVDTDSLLDDQQAQSTVWGQFWSKVEFNDCWQWSGAVTSRGTIQFKVTLGDVITTMNPRRVAYRLLVGPIPKGDYIVSVCRNDSCLNPDHLEVISRSTAIRRWRKPEKVQPEPKDPLLNRRRFAAPGVDDLATLHPDVAATWSTENKVSASNVYPLSNRVAVWVCNEGHRWKAKVSTVVRAKNPCPRCADRGVAHGENDLATMHPDLAAELIDADPANIRANTVSMQRWRCPLGHEFDRRVYTRTRYGLGCPYCNRSVVLAGFNDLTVTHPMLAAQWSPRNDIGPEQVMSGSNRRAIWVCGLGHEFETSPNSRTKGSAYSECPYCANRYVLTGFNDLATTHPELALEYDLSNAKPATQIVFGSNERVKWVCKNGHRWSTTVSARTYLDHSCRRCRKVSSKEESKVFGLLLPHISDLRQSEHLPVSWRYVNEAVVDMFSPSLGLVIEYDGSYWHSGKYDADTAKTKALLDAGYRVIRIREGQLASLGLSQCIEVFGSRHDLESISAEVIQHAESRKM